MHRPVTLYETSKVADKLYFKDTPPGRYAYFEQAFAGYSLEARILFNAQREWPWVLSVHGARADYSKSNAISFALQRRGVSLLGMNLSGQSAASPLTEEQTTPGANIAEAAAFYEYLDMARPKTVISYSFGSVPALKLLADHSSEIDKLVLFYPAIYPTASYDKRYVIELPPVLRQPFAYRQNDTIALLEKFRGKLLVIKGQYDGLDPEAYGKPAGTAAGDVTIGGQTYYSPIPKEVIAMVLGAVPAARREVIEVAGCDHAMSRWLRSHPAEAESLAGRIAAFVCD